MKLLHEIKKYMLKNGKIYKIYLKVKEHFRFYLVCVLTGVYFYGLCINSMINAMQNFTNGTDCKTVSLNPIKCYTAVFTPQGLGVLFFICIMYILIAGKWVGYITGVKMTKDERNFNISNEGTHGTSGWMTKKEQQKVFQMGTADGLPCPILCKLKDNIFEDDKFADYIGLRTDVGLNSHTMVYGASGAGKSRGFVKPFILKMAKFKADKRESMILVDPKGEFFESMSEFLRNQGYVVKAFNLLDMENSDGWNCIGEIGNDTDMVQSVAEIIIRNTADSEQKADFWDKAEQSLLIALILYVQSMRDPITNELLPIHERSLGTIYKMLSTEGQKSLDAKFQKLPLDHPARAPYGIFKQAASNLWGNIFIGLGSRLSVFQNKLVDTITKYHEIDMELPGKQPCAYFCIISAQDSAYEFLSSLFFSLLFKRLTDFARQHGDERGRLPVPVNFVMDEFCNCGKLLDFKKTISVVRSYGINCHIIIQSIAQLADRYPIKEWEEIVGNCDTQLFLGCNDTMTSEFISKRCGNITIQLTNSMAPQTPLFSPITREVTGYRQTKSNNTRPLMYPEEVLQLDNKECLLLIRGQKPLKGYKIIPDEISAFKELKFTRISEYVPRWRRENMREEKEADNNQNDSENTNAEQKEDMYRTPVPNFGTNTENKIGSKEILENETEEVSETTVHVPVEESVFDPDNYEETDAADILNE